jgi:cell wall-associated NlpC family hydrolase
MVSVTDLVGAPFEAGGTGPGYDCYALVREVRRRMGQPIPEYAFPAALVIQPEAVGAEVARALPDWRPCDPVEGALVAIKNSCRWVNHVGIVVAPGQFFHTLEKIGAHLARLDSPLWARRIVGYYTWPT